MARKIIMGTSNEYPQGMFLWRTGENYPIAITKYSFFFLWFICSLIEHLLTTFRIWILKTVSLKRKVIMRLDAQDDKMT